MKKTVMILRERLFSIIRRLGEEPERYARKPGLDFTRKRTLTPAVLIHLILAMGEKSIWKGLLGHFRRRIDTPSASAFVQQRQKLIPSALEDLFHRFSDRLRPQKKFRGYRLLAVDGSSLKSGAYPADKDAYRPGTERQHSWNLFHINALFDLENGIYTDVIVQKEHAKHESRALREMAVRSAITDPVILLADRNYEAYNNFASLEKKGWKYLIRIKDHERKNAYGVKLPDTPDFDLPVRMTLGRLTPQQLKQRGVGGKFARLHRHVDAGHILIHDASGPDIEVPHFRIAHISGGQPHRAPGGVDARRARQGDEPIDVGRPRKAGGIARTGGSQSVAIKNEEQRRGKGHDALPWSWGLSLRPRRVLRDGGTPQAFRHTMREIPSKGIRCGKARARPAGKYARRCR